jgi:hypothetical protein
VEIIQPDGGIIKCPISVHGHLKVTLRHNDGRNEVVVDRSNQVTYLYLDRLAELIAQLASDPDPIDNSIHSLWIEASTIGVSAPTPNDQVPDANATIVAAKIFDDADIVKTISSNVRTVEFRATILESEAIGSTLEAAALFTRGTTGALPADFDLYTAGADGIWMVARQLIGPIPKLGTFAVDFNWGMTFQILDT